MSNQIIRRARRFYPELRDISDDELTLRYAKTEPEYLKNPDFKADYDRITRPQAPVAAPRPQAGAVESLGRGLLGGHQALGGSLWKGTEYLSRLAGIDSLAQEAKENYEQARSYNEMQRNKSAKTGLAGFARMVGEAAPSLLPVIATAGAGLPAAVAASGLTGGLSTLGTAEDAYKARYLREGMSEEEASSKARTSALLPATLSGITTAVVTRAFGATGVEAISGLRSTATAAATAEARQITLAEARKVLATKFIPAAATGAVKEIAEESVDQAAQSVIEKMSFNPELTFAQAIENVMMAGAVGGVLGGGVTAAMRPATVSGAREVVAADVAERQAAAVVEESKQAAIRAKLQREFDESGEISTEDMAALQADVEARGEAEAVESRRLTEERRSARIEAINQRERDLRAREQGNLTDVEISQTYADLAGAPKTQQEFVADAAVYGETPKAPSQGRASAEVSDALAKVKASVVAEAKAAGSPTILPPSAPLIAEADTQATSKPAPVLEGLFNIKEAAPAQPLLTAEGTPMTPTPFEVDVEKVMHGYKALMSATDLPTVTQIDSFLNQFPANVVQEALGRVIKQSKADVSSKRPATTEGVLPKPVAEFPVSKDIVQASPAPQIRVDVPQLLTQQEVTGFRTNAPGVEVLPEANRPQATPLTSRGTWTGQEAVAPAKPVAQEPVRVEPLPKGKKLFANERAELRYLNELIKAGKAIPTDLATKYYYHTKIPKAYGRIRHAPSDGTSAAELRNPEAEVRATLMALMRLLGVTKLPANIKVIWDENGEFAGQYNKDTGEIIINAAQTSNPEATLMEEALHAVWDDPEVQAAWQAVKDTVTGQDVKAQAKRHAVMGTTDEAILMEEAAVAKVVNSSDGVVARLLNAIRRALRKLLGVHMPLRSMGEVRQAAIKKLLSGVGKPESQARGASDQQSDTDRAYLAAVKAGDMKTAQMMVDEAAKKAGYDSPLVYRGDRPKKTQFTGKDHDSRLPGNIFFTDSKQVARAYTKHRTNPMVNYDKLREEDGFYRVRLAMENPLILDANGSSWDEIPTPKELGGGKLQIDDLATRAKQSGYDGVIVKDVLDQTSDGTQYVVFNPSQIKSADPVTRDDQGNVIPLSQRFNTKSSDIRYAPPSRTQGSPPLSQTVNGEELLSWADKLKKEAWASFQPLTVLHHKLAKSIKGYEVKTRLAAAFENLAGVDGIAKKNSIEFRLEMQPLIEGIESDFNEYLFWQYAANRTGHIEAANAEVARLRLLLDNKKLSYPARDGIKNQIKTQEDIAKKYRFGKHTYANSMRKLGQLKAKLTAEGNLARADAAVDAYGRHTTKALTAQLESGYISQKMFDNYRKQSPIFYPMVQTGVAEGRTDYSVSRGIVGIDNPKFKIEKPMDAADIYIYGSHVKAEANKAKLYLYHLARKANNPNAARAVPPDGERFITEPAVELRLNGQPVFVLADPAVVECVALSTKASFGALESLLSKASSALRFGATTASMAFQIKNFLLSDFPTLALMSKAGITNPANAIDFAIKAVTSFAHAFRANILHDYSPEYLAFMESGAMGTSLHSAIEGMGERGKPSDSKGLIASLVDYMGAISQTVEQTPKIAGFRILLKRAGVNSLSQLSPAERVALVSEVRNYCGSPDFARTGSAIKQMRAEILFIFLRAGIAGQSSSLERLTGNLSDMSTKGERGAAAVAQIRAGFLVGLAAYAAYALNHMTDELREDYELVPDIAKNDAFYIPTDEYDTTADGGKVRRYIVIPKRGFIKLIANPIESYMTYTKSKSPEAFSEMLVKIGEELMPLDIKGKNAEERIMGVASSLNPAIRVPIEYATGFTFYSRSRTVPRRLESASVDRQYTERTNENVKSIATLLGVSPLKLEQVMTSVTGGLTRSAFPRKGIEGNEESPSSVPIIKNFISPPYRESADEDMIDRLLTEAANVSVDRMRKATQFVDSREGMDVEAIYREAIDKLGVQNRDVVEKVRELLIQKRSGVTREERRITQLPPKQRAELILHRYARTNPQDRDNLIRSLINKRVITRDTAMYMEAAGFKYQW